MGCHVPSPCHRALQAVALTSQPWWLCFHNWGAQGDAATVRPCVPTLFCKMQCWGTASRFDGSSHHLTRKLGINKQRMLAEGQES